MKRDYSSENFWSKTILIVMCAASLFLAMPTIAANIHDPNMIVYHDSDEGWLMDTIWFYYSGEKRPSFRIESDYGLMMVYLADLSRNILSKFMNITPGLLVLILRWVFLLSWIGALIALWRFIGHHFTKGWQQALGVVLLGVRPAYAYLLNNLKPDGLLTLFMILALDFTLRVIERPSFKNIFSATLFAAFALITKYEGPFVLPAIIAALYLWRRRQNGKGFEGGKSGIIFRELNIAYLLPVFIGGATLALLFGCIFFYVRKSNGLTWYQELGIWETMRRNPAMIYVALVGILMMTASILPRLLGKSKVERIRTIMKNINEIASYGVILSLLFGLLTLLVGIRWVIAPKYFIMTYVPIGYCSVGMGIIRMVPGHGFLELFLKSMRREILMFDPIIFALFVFYLIVECAYIKDSIIKRPSILFKRLTLASFLIIPMGILLFTSWFDQHHMIPFYVAASVLAIQGIDIFASSFNGNRIVKTAVLALTGILLVIDIYANGLDVVRSRIHQFRQSDDVIHDVARWMRENISPGARMVTAPYHHVYIPPEYKNVKAYKGFMTLDFTKFDKFIDENRPQYIYYNHGLSAGEVLPFKSLEEILPGRNVKLVKSFDSSKRRFQRLRRDNFRIYKITY